MVSLENAVSHYSIRTPVNDIAHASRNAGANLRNYDNHVFEKLSPDLGNQYVSKIYGTLSDASKIFDGRYRNADGKLVAQKWSQRSTLINETYAQLKTQLKEARDNNAISNADAADILGKFKAKKVIRFDENVYIKQQLKTVKGRERLEGLFSNIDQDINFTSRAYLAQIVTGPAYQPQPPITPPAPQPAPQPQSQPSVITPPITPPPQSPPPVTTPPHATTPRPAPAPAYVPRPQNPPPAPQPPVMPIVAESSYRRFMNRLNKYVIGGVLITAAAIGSYEMGTAARPYVMKTIDAANRAGEYVGTKLGNRVKADDTKLKETLARIAPRKEAITNYKNSQASKIKSDLDAAYAKGVSEVLAKEWQVPGAKELTQAEIDAMPLTIAHPMSGAPINTGLTIGDVRNSSDASILPTSAANIPPYLKARDSKTPAFNPGFFTVPANQSLTELLKQYENRPVTIETPKEVKKVEATITPTVATPVDNGQIKSLSARGRADLEDLLKTFDGVRRINLKTPQGPQFIWGNYNYVASHAGTAADQNSVISERFGIDSTEVANLERGYRTVAELKAQGAHVRKGLSDGKYEAAKREVNDARFDEFVDFVEYSKSKKALGIFPFHGGQVITGEQR